MTIGARSAARVHVLAALGYLVLALLAYGDVLLAPGDRVVSSTEGDTALYFSRVRAFAAEEMLAGNLPLWNPHVFSGLPFVGGFQSALFYPPNATYLALPLDTALNLDVVLHVTLLGLLSFAWVRSRGVGDAPAFLAGAFAMLCGACTVRVLAGQLTVLSAAAWTPLVWLAAERLTDRPTLGWTLTGIAAASLQILAGYPFYAFASAFFAGLLVAVRLPRAESPLRSLAALAAMGAVPILISAVQLWPGLATAAESLRARGVPFWFASAYSTHAQHLLTAVAPGFFGDDLHSPYWGKWAFWDDAVFLGVVSLLLAIYGGWRGPRQQRRFAGLLALLALALAMGRDLPLFEWAFHWVPGFDLFRAPSKFALHASLFAALLAGVGLDRLRRESRGCAVLALAALVASLLLLGGGAWIHGQAAGPEAGAFREVVRAAETPIDFERLSEADAFVPAARAAATALLLAGATALGAAGLLALRRRTRVAVWLLAGLGVVELLVFARAYRGGFSLASLRSPVFEQLVSELPEGSRVLDLAGHNRVMDVGAHGVWGYDPVQLDRYTRFLAATQTGRAIAPDRPLPLAPDPVRAHPLLAALRARLLVPREFPGAPAQTLPDALPRVLLVGAFRRMPKARLLESMLSAPFDPRQRVYLEEEPSPLPSARGASGRAVILEESTDHLLVEVDAPAPALLLVTDAYSRDWSATLLPSDAAEARALRVLPADYTLMAVALPGGRHRVRLEYLPEAFRIGAPVSIATSLAWLGVAVVWWRRREVAVESAQNWK